MAESVRYKNDKRLRDRLFTPESYQHPAKGHLGMWQDIILRYTKPDDLILDPMAGIGTSLVAALMGRNVVCVELEQHFIEPMKASWAKMQQHPMLGYEMGAALILRGDARHLPIGSADAIVTSPPFADNDNAFHDKNPPDWYAKKQGKAMPGYTRPSAIISSPPYEGSQVASSIGDVPTSGGIGTQYRKQGMVAGDLRKAFGIGAGYTRPVDAVVSSPPWQDAREGGTIAKTGAPHDTTKLLTKWAYTRPSAIVTSPPFSNSTQALPENIHIPLGNLTQDDLNHVNKVRMGATDNIGNQKGGDLYAIIEAQSVDGFPESYWKSMFCVYQECHRVLRDGGVMVLVLKGFTRDGKYMDLPGDTQEMCESLGFKLFDRWRRELWSLSFWRILQKRRDPAAFDERLKFEEVLAFRKEGENGDGLSAVVTSPPYEGIDVTQDSESTTQGNAKTGQLHRGYTRIKEGG